MRSGDPLFAHDLPGMLPSAEPAASGEGEFGSKSQFEDPKGWVARELLRHLAFATQRAQLLVELAQGCNCDLLGGTGNVALDTQLARAREDREELIPAPPPLRPICVSPPEAPARPHEVAPQPPDLSSEPPLPCATTGGAEEVATCNITGSQPGLGDEDYGFDDGGPLPGEHRQSRVSMVDASSRWKAAGLKVVAAKRCSTITTSTAPLICDEVPERRNRGRDQLPPEVWPIWRQSPKISGRVSTSSEAAHCTWTFGGSRLMQDDGGDQTKFADFVESNWLTLRRFIVHPSSPQRVTWDAFSLIVVVYDLLTMPLQVFGFDSLRVAGYLHLVTAVFWSCDMPATFCTAFYKDGVIVGYPSRIAQHYMMRTFFLDLVLVVSDWIILGIPSGGDNASDFVDAARIGKVVRLVRLMRIFRLLRVAKFLEVSARLADMLVTSCNYSEGLWGFIGMFKLIFSVVVINHFIACAWYSVGNREPYEQTWIKPLVEEDANQWYRYVVSFHWTIAQFTPAPNNYHPQNCSERTFAIGTLLLGFTMFSSFLGSITSMITYLRKSAQTRTQEDMKVREFLSQNSISVSLGNNIISYLRTNRQQARRRVLEVDAVALQRLPGLLLMELHWETHQKVLDQHPLFLQVTKDNQVLARDLCHEALSQVAVVRGHELFQQGGKATAAFSILSGSLDYSFLLTPHADEQSVTLGSGEWLCEAVLWIKSKHRGNCCARSTAATVARVGSDVLRTITERHLYVAALCRRYVEQLVEQMLACGAEGRLDNWWTVDLAKELLDRAGLWKDPVVSAIDSEKGKHRSSGLGFVEKMFSASGSKRTSATS